jgi:hypothetical protein
VDGALERVIENLEEKIDDCWKELQSLIDVKKVARQGGKDELTFMVETTKYLEDATNDTGHSFSRTWRNHMRSFSMRYNSGIMVSVISIFEEFEFVAF